MKKLPIGIHSFRELRAGDFYYVDKTAHIKDAMESWPHGSLFSRPRHFGKTLFLDTLARFLEIDPENPGSSKKNAELFSGLKILEDREFCKAHMGQYPVIFFSFQSVVGKTYEEAVLACAKLVQNVAREFPYLLESSKLTESQKQEIACICSDKFIQNKEDFCVLKFTFRHLIEMLSAHFDREVVVLIDDVDAPLESAAANGYYSRLHDFLLYFLDCNLYPGSGYTSYLNKAILTGHLRPLDEELIVITDMYKLMFETVLSGSLDSCDVFGFTEPELKAVLQDYGLSSRFDDLRIWYGGYRVAKRELYTPESVIRFCQKALDSKEPLTFAPANEWINLETDAVLDRFFELVSGEITDNLQKLIDGETIDVRIEPALRYTDFDRGGASYFWTYFLYLGYLSVADSDSQCSDQVKLRIPNEEVRATFIEKVQKRFSNDNASFSNYGRDFVRAALRGDVDTLNDVLSSVLDGYVSVRDMATKAPHENYYHGMLNALCACGSGHFEFFKSNVDSGGGYANLAFTDKIASNRTGVVIEIKYAAKQDDLYDVAQSALDQIKEKNYGSYLEKFRCKKQRLYGIAFSGKSCVVLSNEDA